MSTNDNSFIINLSSEICRLSKHFKYLSMQEVKTNKTKQNKCIMGGWELKKEAS